MAALFSGTVAPCLRRLPRRALPSFCNSAATRAPRRKRRDDHEPSERPFALPPARPASPGGPRLLGALLALGLGADAASGQQPPPAYQYAAKVVCGHQKDPKELRLTRGLYATTINIHNPGREPVKFFKKLALSYPPEEQRPGKVIRIAEDVLKDDEALKVDCPDLERRLFPGGFPNGYIEGFVVIESPASLDVTAVYTTAAVDDEKGP